MKTELLNVQPVISSLKVYNKKYNNEIKKAIAKFMTKTRLRAADYIIPKSKSTYKEQRWVPSTPGRLTARTGRLQFMLRHKASYNNLLRSWGSTWNNILQHEDTVALRGLIREFRTSKDIAYIGTYKVLANDHPNLTSYRKGLPVETRKSLAMRFTWEFRGRPIFSPVVEINEIDFRNLLRNGLGTLKL